MSDSSEASPLLSVSIAEPQKPKSLGVLSAAAFIISVFGVPPLVALPGALQYCGVLGFLIVPLLLIINAYTAILLARSRIILEENWPIEASLQSRYPYSSLAEKSGGPVLRRFVNIIQNMAIFGEAVPFLLLASENLQNVINGTTDDDGKFTYCYIIITTAIFLIPFLWIGTPKDLGFMTWIGAASLAVVFVLMISLLLMGAPRNQRPYILPSSMSSLAYCFGAVAFQFGIHPVLLTLQTDMKEKEKLPQAIIIAFVGSSVVFGGISTVAFFLYGKSVQANILNNFPDGTLLYITQGIVSVQSLICLALGINALLQDLELTVGIEDTFGWPRILLRSTVMLFVLFVAESIPHFAVSLQLVGGLLMTPLVYIFPPLFYIIIKHKAMLEIKRWEVAIAAGIILLGIIGCVASTAESGIQISELKKFAPPCYVNVNFDYDKFMD